MRTNTDSNDIWIVTDCIITERLCLFEDRTNLNALSKYELKSIDFKFCRHYLSQSASAKNTISENKLNKYKHKVENEISF